MTYSSTQLIQASDYNNFVWGDAAGTGSVITSNDNLYLLWGPGYANKGLNQSFVGLTPGLPGSVPADSSGTLTQVDGLSAGTVPDLFSGDLVTAQQWIGFYGTLNRLRYFQAGSSGNVTLSPLPGQGKTIQTFASVSTKLTDASTWFDSANPTQGVATTSQSTSFSKSFNIGDTAANLSNTVQQYIDWPSGDDIRWFFNSGGYVRVSVSARNNTGNPSDRTTAMVSTVRAMGSVIIKGYSNTGYSGRNQSLGIYLTGYWNGLYHPFAVWQLGGYELGSTSYPTTSIYGYARIANNGGNGTQGGALGQRLHLRWDMLSPYATWTSLYKPTDTLDFDFLVTIDIVDQSGSGSTIARTWGLPSPGNLF